MDYDLLIKTVTVAIGIVSAARLIYDLAIGKGGRMREEYKFAKDFLDEVRANENLHPYLREKGYQAIAGDQRIRANEIEYLLSLKESDRALKDYVLAREYLEHLPEAGNLQISFKKKYIAAWPRQWRKTFYVIAYALLAFLVSSPLLLSRFLFKNPGQMFIALIIFGSVFGPYAWMALKEGTRIFRAEKLVKNQEKYKQMIVLSRFTNH